MKEKPLYQPSYLTSLMKEYDLSFTKSLGQNFLVDGNVLRRIVRAAGPGPKDTVLEIGPGVGTLTQELLAQAGEVISIEIDQRFLPVLEKEFGGNPKFSLIGGDALKMDLGAVAKEKAKGERTLLIANLPYYITTPLLEQFLTKPLPIDSFTVMVQKEVAERITAEPSTKEYGALTLFVALYGQAKWCFDVSKNSFFPRPKVDSAVVQIQQKKGLDYERADRINQVIRLAFQQRRKYVMKALERATGKDRLQLLDAFQKLGLSPQARPADLALEHYGKILEEVGFI